MAVYRVGTNKSSVNNFPSIRPTLDLDFANTKTLDPKITFTRASGGSYVGADGLIKYAGVNEARFDHDPETGESLGLLVEESRTNIILNSSDTSLWPLSTNMVPSGNPIVVPDGSISTTVEYRGETTEPNSKFLRSSPSGAIVAGETWTFSVFLRAGTERTVNVVLSNSTATEGVRVNTFNMLTGEYSSIIESNVTNGRFGVIPHPNGWWRVWISCTFTSSASGFQTVIRLFGFSNLVPFTTSFSAWGAQLERGSFPTSYIPTQGSSRTRAADNARITGKNFSSFYNPSEGTIYAEANPGSFVAQRVVCDLGPNALNRITLLKMATGNALWFVNNGNNIQALLQFSPWNTTGKLSGAYKLNDFASSFNGSTVLIDDNGILPENVNKMDIGKRADSSNYLNGTISRIAYYPKRLTNSQLQVLTR